MNPTFKILFFATKTFDKKRIFQRLCTQVFQDENLSVGVDFYIKEIIHNGKLYKLQIWTLHTEARKYRFLNPTYCLGTSGAFIAINLSKDFSTKEIISWIEMIKKANKNAPIILLITKSKYSLKKSKIHNFINHLNENIKFDETVIINSQSIRKLNKSFILLTKLRIKSINS